MLKGITWSFRVCRRKLPTTNPRQQIEPMRFEHLQKGCRGNVIIRCHARATLLCLTLLAIFPIIAYYHCNVRSARIPNGLRYFLYTRAQQVYLLMPMDRATLLHEKSTILHGPSSLITRQRASVDSKLLHTPRNVGYYRIFERKCSNST